MGSCTVLLALVALVAASPVPKLSSGPRNSALESIVLNLLEGFRELMVTGSDDVPVLDPFRTEHLDLDLNELLQIENSRVTLQNVEARYLSTFVIDDLTMTLTSLLQQRYDLDVEGHIPVIELDADHYDLSIDVMGFRVFGAGTAKIVVKEPRIIAKLEISISLLSMAINLRDAHVVVKLGAIEPQLTGMFDNTLTDDFVNLFLKNLIEDVVITFQDEITEIVSNLVMEIGSELLANLDLGSILSTTDLKKLEKAGLQQL